MKSLRKYATRRNVYIGIGVLAIAAAGWLLLGGRSSSSTETLILAPKDFNETVPVSGTVIAAQDVDLGFSQGGRIASVRVSVGDRVAQGQVLASVENGDLAANVSQQQALLEQQQAKLASLRAGAQPADIAASQAALDKATQDLANDYSSIIDVAQSAYTSANDAVRTQLSSLFSGAEGSSPTLTFSTSNSQSAIDAQNMRIQVGAALNAWQSEMSALPAKPSNAQLDTLLSDSLSSLASVRMLLSKVSAALDSSNLSAGAVSTDKALVVAGQTEVNGAVKSLNGASQTIASQISTVSQTQAQLDLKKSGATAQDIAAQEAQVNQAEAAVVSARAQLNKTIIAAPFGGIVTRVDAKVGLAVSANAPQISVESAGNFQIEAYIPEVSIAQVAVGNKATVTLDAYGAGVPFSATVISIDPAETMRDGVSTYRVLLQFDANDPRIRSGMTATVGITTAQHANALVVPGGAIFTKNGQQMVQVRRDKEVVDIAVTTGGSAIGEIEILSGLSSGDEVVLNPDPTR